MKKVLILLVIIILSSCDQPESRYNCVGELTSIRIDDDAEYHFTTDSRAFNDIFKSSISIQRNNIEKPILYIYEERCAKDKFCPQYSEEWHEYKQYYKIILPYNYKIETFDD